MCLFSFICVSNWAGSPKRVLDETSFSRYEKYTNWHSINIPVCISISIHIFFSMTKKTLTKYLKSHKSIFIIISIPWELFRGFISIYKNELFYIDSNPSISNLEMWNSWINNCHPRIWHINEVMFIVWLLSKHKDRTKSIRSSVVSSISSFIRIEMLINHIKWFRLHQRQISDIKYRCISILPVFNVSPVLKQQHQTDKVSNRKGGN